MEQMERMERMERGRRRVGSEVGGGGGFGVELCLPAVSVAFSVAWWDGWMDGEESRGEERRGEASGEWRVEDGGMGQCEGEREEWHCWQLCRACTQYNDSTATK